MATINVDGAAARLLANGALAKAGYCLYYCWLAISQGRVHYLTSGSDTAYNTWLAVPAEHQHSSRTVPKDMPAFLGPKLLSRAGDVIISRGDGTFAATDWPKSKQVGICTLAQRENQTGRKFVGWASSMGGHTLVTSGFAGETGSPITDSQTAPKRRNNDMSKLYQLDGTTTYALAGDAPGTPANWLETSGIGLANGWSAQIGAASIPLSQGTWDAYKAAYLAPLNVTGITGGTTNVSALTAQDKADIIAAIAANKPPHTFVGQ